MLRHPPPAGLRLRFLLGAAVVAGLFLVQLWEHQASAGRRVGVSLDRRDGAVVVTEVTPGLPAERGGLQVGDRLLALAGRPLVERDSYDEIAAGFTRGAPVVFSIERQGESRQVTIVPGTSTSWVPVAMVALILAAYLALAGLAARQSEGDVRAALLQIFSLAVAFEFALPGGLIGSPRLALASGVLAQLINGVQFGLELHLASVLPERPEWVRRRPWLIRLYYVVGLAFGVGVAGTQLLEGLGLELLRGPGIRRRPSSTRSDSRSGRWRWPRCSAARCSPSRSPAGDSRPGWCSSASCPGSPRC